MNGINGSVTTASNIEVQQKSGSQKFQQTAQVSSTADEFTGKQA